jgi:hypothetical protein
VDPAPNANAGLLSGAEVEPEPPKVKAGFGNPVSTSPADLFFFCEEVSPADGIDPNGTGVVSFFSLGGMDPKANAGAVGFDSVFSDGAAAPNENAGFGASSFLSVAAAPNENAGFGASSFLSVAAVDVAPKVKPPVTGFGASSILSVAAAGAGAPNENAGFGASSFLSVAAVDVDPKVKPPVTGFGASFFLSSVFAAPKVNPPGAFELAAPDAGAPNENLLVLPESLLSKQKVGPFESSSFLFFPESSSDGFSPTTSSPFGVSQARQLLAVFGFDDLQVRHVQVPSSFLNMFPHPCAGEGNVVSTCEDVAGVADEDVAEIFDAF